MPKLSRVDAGLLLTLLLCGFALLPLRQAGLSAGYDVLYHTYRVAEMQRSWEAGILMPRWAESFYYGYGYPVFHYYASLTYYLTSIAMTLTGVSAIGALRGVIVLSLLGGGSGMYLWIRQRWGQASGLVAALVYVYAPYVIYTEPYTRGDYPELLAFGWMPWLFWRFDALRQPAQSKRQQAMRIATATLSVLILIISHNLMAVVFFGLLIGWLLWLYLVKAIDWRRLVLMLATAACGVALAGYFWIPTLLESDAVQLDNLIEIAELDYRNFFVPDDVLFGVPPRADAGAVNGLLPQYATGVAAWVLGLAGGLWLLVNFVRRRSDSNQQAMGYFALMAILMLFMITPHSLPIWERVDFLAFLQFPWRFLGPAAGCLAVLAGISIRWLDALPKPAKQIALVGICLLPIGLAIPRFYVPQWSLTDVDTSVAAYQEEEVSGRQRGTTFSGEYLPKTVAVVASPNQRLLEDFADGRPVDHLHRAVLPSDASAILIRQNPHYNEWQIESPQAFRVEVLTFDFPGWQARVNGEVAEITPSEPHGFITFEVPAGRSTVVVEMVNTPARWLGYAITGLGVLAILGVVWVANRWLASEAAPTSPPKFDVDLRVIAVGVLVISIPLLLITFREGVAWLDSPAGEAYAAQESVRYQLGDSMQLLGYDLSGTSFSAGDRVDIALYWYAEETPTAGYASFIHITSHPEAPPVAQSDRLNPGGVPTLAWQNTGYYYDEHHIYLPDGLPPGEYFIRVGLWTCDGIPADTPCGNGIRPRVFAADGSEVGDAIPLISIRVD